MDMEAVRRAFNELFALCALSAIAGTLIEDERIKVGLRAVFGLSIALTIARLISQMLGSWKL